jgi:hypothetical protein
MGDEFMELAGRNVRPQHHDVEQQGDRRLVRTWALRPQPGAKTEDLGKWQLVGPADPARSQLAASAGERAFMPCGTLQEFIAGDERTGGAYCQIFTLQETPKVRVTTIHETTVAAAEYREVLKRIDRGEYARFMSSRLYFMSGAETGNVVPFPNRR